MSCRSLRSLVFAPLLFAFLFISLVSSAVASEIVGAESARRFNWLGDYGKLTEQHLEDLFSADFFFSKVGKAKQDPHPYGLLELARKRRPGAKVLVYEISYGRAEHQVDWDEVNQHEDWFLHEGGRRIKYGSYWLMNLGAPAYIDHIVKMNIEVARKYGYDGVFLDHLFCQSWLRKHIGCEFFEHSVKRLMKGFKQKNPQFFVMYNGLRSGWPDDNIQYLKWADGVFIEKFCNHDCDRLQDPQTTKTYVKRLRELDRGGKIALVSATYQCHDIAAGLNQTQVQDYSRYCLAAYLIGMGDHTFYRVRVFNPKVPESGIGIREQPVLLGRPSGEPAVIDGVFIRDFSRGRVFWNPTETDVDIGLRNPLFTPSGQKVQQVRIKKRSGEILFKRMSEGTE